MSCRKWWIHSLDPSLRNGPWRLTFLVTILTACEHHRGSRSISDAKVTHVRATFFHVQIRPSTDKYRRNDGLASCVMMGIDAQPEPLIFSTPSARSIPSLSPCPLSPFFSIFCGTFSPNVGLYFDRLLTAVNFDVDGMSGINSDAHRSSRYIVI
jgi:hypothetical protein